MKVLVTGGAGFVGSHLVSELVDRGNEVWVLDDLSTGLESNLGDLPIGSFRLVNGSILDSTLVKSLMRQEFDVVYHLAAVVGVYLCLKDPREVFRVNTVGSEVLYEALLSCPKKPKVIITSTSEVAGKTGAIPLAEDSTREFGSTTVSRWVYGESKAIEEMLGIWYGKHFGFDVQIFRLFNVIGPRQRGEYGMVVPKLITQALLGKPITVFGDGTQVRSFTWVGDVVKGIIDLGNLEPNSARPKVFNLGNPRPISINELAQIVKEKTLSASPIVHVPFKEAFGGEEFEEIHTRIPNSTLAEIYGWRPTVDFEESVDYCIKHLFSELNIKNPKLVAKLWGDV